MEAEVTGNEEGGTLGYTMGTRRPTVMRTDADDRIHAIGPRNVTYQDLRELPSDSGELCRELERLYAEDGGADTGIGFAFPGTARTPLGSVEQRLVVDRSTGEQLVLVEPSARAQEAGLDAGTTVNYSATTRMTWGESQNTVPENARP